MYSSLYARKCVYTGIASLVYGELSFPVDPQGLFAEMQGTLLQVSAQTTRSMSTKRV